MVEMTAKDTSRWWWFDSHNSSKRSPWLQSTLTGKHPIALETLALFILISFYWFLTVGECELQFCLESLNFLLVMSLYTRFDLLVNKTYEGDWLFP